MGNSLNRKNQVNAKLRTEKIIQFGSGNFLRAFVDWIVQKMNDNANFDAGIVIVTPTPTGRADKLNEQDCLYHVNLQGLENGKQINSIELIDSVNRAINPYLDFEKYMELATQADIRFVISNTTEAGIEFDANCKLEDAPASSFPAKLTQLLYKRYKFFNGDKSKGLIILPCELIFHNGRKLKETIYQYIKLWKLEDDFKIWFEEACKVYSTLVDRIVSGFPKNDISEIEKEIGFNDKLLVRGEIFHLWVIEAPEDLQEEFPANKIGLNILFVPSEDPYHRRKVTLLNAPHTVLSPIAWLAGLDIVRDACKHELVGKFIKNVMHEELLPTLDLPKPELEKFACDVLERFENPFIDHALTSIMLNSFSKYLARVLPSLKIYFKENGKLPKGLVLGLVAILVYYGGYVRQDGAKAEPKDTEKVLSIISELWAQNSVENLASEILSSSEIWGEDLTKIPELKEMFTYYISNILQDGMLNTLQKI